MTLTLPYYQSLLQLTQVDNFECLLNFDTALCSSSTSTSSSNFRHPDLGTHFTITHAPIIAEYEKELHDYHDIPCVCCERLCQRKGVTHVKLSDNLGNTVWPRIKTYILDHNPIAANTMETLEKVKDTCLLPSPELYIIVNGKGKVVWCSLVDVNDLTAAVQKVQQINWLYKDIDEQSLDQVTKQVKEVTSNTTSTMLVKATKEDVAEFQCYTIRNMDNKLSTGSDVDQYKIKNVQESPINNKQLHLDVMCFPVLFPTGEFGKHHTCEIKLSNSEYIKS